MFVSLCKNKKGGSEKPPFNTVLTHILV